MFTVKWSIKSDQPVECFGEKITIQLVGQLTENNLNEEINVTLMKPSTLFENNVSLSEYEMFPFWLSTMMDLKLSLARPC